MAVGFLLVWIGGSFFDTGSGRDRRLSFGHEGASQSPVRFAMWSSGPGVVMVCTFGGGCSSIFYWTYTIGRSCLFLPVVDLHGAAEAALSLIAAQGSVKMVRRV